MRCHAKGWLFDARFEGEESCTVPTESFRLLAWRRHEHVPGLGSVLVDDGYPRWLRDGLRYQIRCHFSHVPSQYALSNFGAGDVQAGGRKECAFGPSVCRGTLT